MTSYQLKKQFKFKNHKKSSSESLKPIETKNASERPVEEKPKRSANLASLELHPQNIKLIEKLSNKSLILGEQDIQNSDLSLFSLEKCEIFILATITAARLTSLKNCTIWLSSVETSVLVYQSFSSNLILNTHQLRIHDSHDLEIYLRSRTPPIIEKSYGILFAPYFPKQHSIGNIKEEKIQDHSDDSMIWSKVLDFDWHRKQPSPNWAIKPNAIPNSFIEVIKISSKNSSMLKDHFLATDDSYIFENWEIKGFPSKFFVNSQES